ncbi:MAG: hypothetical protein ABI904_12105 [Chloroflexota bacterium]
MNLVNLDDITRKYMLEEITSDIKANKLYRSKRLTSNGLSDYERLLHEAVEKYDADWLALQLKEGGRMAALETSHSKTGRPIVKHTPASDHITLADGEFNYYYVRGLCRRAIDENVEYLEVYRAKEVMQQRAQSSVAIGSKVNPKELLDDLRVEIGLRGKRFGICSGPNSGISIRF